MNALLVFLLSFTSLLALYWVLHGQWKWNRIIKERDIKAVIFDMDGVLIDSLDTWHHLFNKSLEHYGKEKISKEDFLDKYWGGPIERDVELFNTTVEELKKFYFDNFDEFFTHVKLIPNAIEILEELKKKGIKLALVTNTPKKQAHRMFDNFKLEKYFDAIICGGEVKRGKPAPDVLFEVLKRLELHNDEAVYVGDTDVDIKAGRRGRMFTIGYKVNGDGRVEDLRDIVKFVGKT